MLGNVGEEVLPRSQYLKHHAFCPLASSPQPSTNLQKENCNWDVDLMDEYDWPQRISPVKDLPQGRKLAELLKGYVANQVTS